LGFGHHEAVMVIYAVQAALFVLAYFLRYESDLTHSGRRFGVLHRLHRHFADGRAQRMAAAQSRGCRSLGAVAG
jgi:hypothetical protein